MAQAVENHQIHVRLVITVLYVFEAAFVHFKAHGSAPRDILSYPT
jgi:hypothetical protein